MTTFDWTDLSLDKQARLAPDNLLVEFKDIFARHIFETGIINDFKIKLAPIDESPANTNQPERRHHSGISPIT